ncbi:MAG: GNAT family protein [Actinomycetota bacterium]
MKKRIMGERTFLRPLTLDDLDELLALRVRNRAFFTPYEPVLTDADFTRSAVRFGIELSLREEREGLGYAFAICRVGDDAMVGRIRVSSVFRGPWQNANFGYYVDESSMGQGHATEAVKLATQFCFGELGLHRVQAAVLTDNPRSMRVLEKAGFRKEGLALRYLQINGEWRDHFIFARTVEDV